MSVADSSEATNCQVILIVDDESDILELLNDLLSEEGFTVVQASNGKQGFILAQQHLPHLILSDVMMPDMSGIELCFALHQIPTTAHIPIILMSAVNLDVSQYVSVACIPKPFNIDGLLSLIQQQILKGI